MCSGEWWIGSREWSSDSVATPNLLRWPWTQADEQHRTGGENRKAHQLRWSQAGVAMRLRVIPAKQFDKRTQRRVGHEVAGEHLAVEFLVTIEPGERGVEPQAQQRLINLRRMQRHAWRRTAGLVGWKRDRPRQRTFAPKAATVHQAADAPEDVAQRNARRED